MMFAPPSQHASISPSRLQRIIDCPGSYRLTRDVEETESSSFAQEGTMLHSVVERHFRLHGNKGFSIPVDPTLAEPPLEAEQLTAVQDCVDYLANVVKPLLGPSLTIKVEEKVYLKQFHQSLYECYGTCDIILETDRELHVIDWKFGKGVPVYVENNDQLLAYLAGAIGSFEELFPEVQYPVPREYHMHIVQPRLENYDHIKLTAEEVDQWISMRLIPGVTRAYEQHAPFCPGTKQCRWCPAAGTCRARFNQANKTAADVFGAHARLPDEITLDEIAKFLQQAKALEEYIKALRLHVQQSIEDGQEVPGWKVVRGRSLRKWKDLEAAEEALPDLLEAAGHGFDEAYVSKFISPAQAEKLLGRASKTDPDLQELIVKPDGKPTLVVESDKRAPINFKPIEQRFQEAVNGRR